MFGLSKCQPDGSLVWPDGPQYDIVTGGVDTSTSKIWWKKRFKVWRGLSNYSRYGIGSSIAAVLVTILIGSKISLLILSHQPNLGDWLPSSAPNAKAFQLIIGEDISNCRFQILFDGNCSLFNWLSIIDPAKRRRICDIRFDGKCGFVYLFVEKSGFDPQILCMWTHAQSIIWTEYFFNNLLICFLFLGERKQGTDERERETKLCWHGWIVWVLLTTDFTD